VRMELKWILGRLAGGVEWIQLAQSRGRWRAVISTVTNPWVLSTRNYFIQTCMCKIKKTYII
jgi:hypothetical protein